MKHHMLSGIDRIDSAAGLLKDRVGLMTNPTGVNHKLESTIDILRSRCDLTALYAVEHGIRGDAQAGDAVHNAVDPLTGLTVFSAYGENCRFNAEMLDAFDTLVFDIQDVGARFYTYLYSLAYAMEACTRAHKRMVVLDRVDPLGGLKRQGTVLDRAFASFVGDYELPTRYGLTIGEYALYVRDLLKLDVDLRIVPLTGWSRDLYLDDTDLPWIAPSPNCPDLAAALCYIGTCVFEGTNISEGRGTTQPFQLVGAPWLDAHALAAQMNAIGLPGLHFRPVFYTPTFSKHAGTLCRGVQMHITDRDAADPVAGGLHLLETIRRLSGDSFRWLEPAAGQGYHIDHLLGTDLFRTERAGAAGLLRMHEDGIAAFSERVKPYLLY